MRRSLRVYMEFVVILRLWQLQSSDKKETEIGTNNKILQYVIIKEDFFFKLEKVSKWISRKINWNRGAHYVMDFDVLFSKA